MEQLIIHPHPMHEGRICIVTPAPNCGLSLTEIARKDVPAGFPYLIISRDMIPDQTFFEAFEADFSNPDGYGIGAAAWFAERNGGVQA